MARTGFFAALVNKLGKQINPATEETVSSISGSVAFPGGTGVNGSVTLTNANTAYSVPSTSRSTDFVLVCWNGTDTDMFWGFENTSFNGVRLAAGDQVAFNLKAGQYVYFYCDEDSKTITYTLKEL